jgi:hypothetical protein
MNPKMEKAPEKVAPISVPLLHDYQNSAEMKNTQSEHLLLFKNGIRDGFVTGTKEEERSENVLKSLHSIGVYLFWEPQNIPTRNSSIVFYNNLQVLKLADGDGVEGDIEENEAPLEEGVDGVRCVNISFCGPKYRT